MSNGFSPAHATPGCCHYWIIEAALGVMSRGACTVCGEERLFRNNPLPSEFAQFKAIPDPHEANAGFEMERGGEYHPFPPSRNRYPKPQFI